MIFLIPISYNLRSLAVRRTTTLVTVAGIALVVFVLAGALMLSRGIERTLGKTGSRDRAIVLRKGSDAELSSSIEAPTVSLIRAAPGVKKDANGAPIGVGEIVVVLAMDKVGSTTGGISNVQVRGVPDGTMAFHKDVRIVEGRPPQPGTGEGIVGARVRGRFRGVDLGSTFELRKNRPVKIVGVFEDGGSSLESEVWVDIDSVRAAFGREGLVSSVHVQLESPQVFEAFESQVEQDKRLGLDALREDKYYEKQSENTAQFVRGLGILVAVIFSIGAMIGAMITMYGSIAGRRREIGTLRALGFSRAGILLSFLLEALLLALLGGVVGTAASLLLGLVQFSMVNFMSWSEIVFSFTPTPGILLAAVLFGGLMGLCGGFFPAVRAARTSPIQAMRD